MDLEEFERELGHMFANRSLLLEALTHKTWLMEQRARGFAHGQGDQQRLEFLGDAFLGYEVARRLFADLPDADEGRLTARRRRLVEGGYIQAVGLNLGVLDWVRVGRGERANLHKNKKIHEDTVEALVGAVLLDSSEEVAREFVWRHFELDAGGQASQGSAIVAFVELWQGRNRTTPPAPSFTSVGPAHDPSWRAVIQLPNGPAAVGSGPSRAKARVAACEHALLLMEGSD